MVPYPRVNFGSKPYGARLRLPGALDPARRLTTDHRPAESTVEETRAVRASSHPEAARFILAIRHHSIKQPAPFLNLFCPSPAAADNLSSRQPVTSPIRSSAQRMMTMGFPGAVDESEHREKVWILFSQLFSPIRKILGVHTPGTATLQNRADCDGTADVPAITTGQQQSCLTAHFGITYCPPTYLTTPSPSTTNASAGA